MNESSRAGVLEGGSQGPRQITLSFVTLGVAVILVTLIYWYAVLQPRLELAGDANAKLLAQTQAVILAEVLQPRGDPISSSEVSATMDRILLATDPASGRPFFIRIELEIDYFTVPARVGSLDLQRGAPCTGECILVEAPLIAPLTDELLGIARFHVSGDLFFNLRRDIRHTLAGEALLILLLLLLSWRWIYRLGRRLQREVIERRRAEEEARAADRAKSQFLANMSHEIRTPITAIQGFLYLAQQDQSGITERLADYLRKMEHSTRSLLSIINDILDFSKIEAGRVELEETPFDLYAVVDRVRSLAGLQASRRALELSFDLSKETPRYLRGDPERIAQVLLNLVGNAVKFTEQGAVRLAIDGEKQGRVVLLRVAVEDTGIGISTEQQERLFRVFSQADESITRRFGGTGLGLAISQRLVDRMGGRIEVESEEGRGSTFRFTIRLQPAEKAEVDALAQSRGNGGKDLSGLQGARVLLVEDQPLNQEVACEILRRIGIEVEIAQDGQEAVDRLTVDPHAFDGILMDLQMPVLDGYGATRALHADPRLRRMPIIAMTANALAGERERCLAAGMTDYLSKPIQVDELHRVLLLWVAASPARRSVKVRREPVGPGRLEGKALPLPHQAPGIALSKGLERVGGNAILYSRLLSRFPGQYAASVGRIEEAIARRDYEVARQQAHAVAGVAGNLAAERLEIAMRELHRALDPSIETPHLPPLIEKMRQAMGEVVQSIRSLGLVADEAAADVGDMAVDAETAVLPADAPWLTELEDILDLLSVHDLQARQRFQVLLDGIEEAGIRRNLEPIAALVDGLRFGEAHDRLQELLRHAAVVRENGSAEPASGS